MNSRILGLIGAIALAAALAGFANARDFEMGSDNDYPYSIMKPEPGSPEAKAARQRLPPPTRTPPHASLLGREEFVAKLHRRGLYAVRGSSGSVLPTALPRTQLMVPPNTSRLATPNLPQEQGGTIVPGTIVPVPNLPHGTETFQDRASRCAHQAGLYGSQGGSNPNYMAACSM
jgi:hypothetical protein